MPLTAPAFHEKITTLNLIQMKRKFMVTAGFIGVLIILAAVKIFLLPGENEKKAVTAATPALPVEVFLVKDTTVDYTIETVGSLRANEQVEIVGELTRKITGIYLREGTQVASGQLLFKLDDADITARINKLEIEERLAAANEAREKILLQKGGISQERFDEISNIRQTLQAEIGILKVELDKTEIRAPFAGKAGLRNVSIGTLVTPGTVLAGMQDVSRIKIDFGIPERYASDLRPGSRISFQTDNIAGQAEATIEAMEPAVDERTRTLRVRAIAGNEKGLLVAGSSARIKLTIHELTGSIFVPTSALIPSIRGYTVFTVRGGKAEPVSVTTGTRQRDFVQITGGLAAGDTVVTTNLLRVREGSLLKIVKAN